MRLFIRHTLKNGSPGEEIEIKFTYQKKLEKPMALWSK